MEPRQPGIAARILRPVAAFVCAMVMTLALFLVLPLMQSIRNPIRDDWMVRDLDVGQLEPPPPPPPEQEEEEDKPPPPPPKLAEQAPPLDLSQLELALNPGLGGAGFGDFVLELEGVLGSDATGGGLGDIFDLADLDQKPRAIFQRQPVYPQELLRRHQSGTVYVIFRVDTNGRVQDAKVEKSTHPAFEEPAVEAVRQWRFEPGTRNGEKVPFKIRIPITFNAG